jgi:serine/threonine protein kinase
MGEPMSVEDALRSAGQRVGTTIDGKYRITDILGVGGMGVVYEADHLFLGRKVALKALHPRYEDGHDAQVRFLREARAAGLVLHRTIVEVLDAGFVDGTTPYLVMERLHGENLRERLQRRQALRFAQGVNVLVELAKGLAAAHAKGVVHCDLKPENVFLVNAEAEPGKVKILDFGVARMTGTSGIVGAGTAGGTPAYMAPEQMRGDAFDARTDLYALGAVVFDALAGVPPFPPEPAATIYDRVLTQPAPRLVGKREKVPPGFVDLVASMLAKDPAQRPASAVAVLDILDTMGLLGDGSSPALSVRVPGGVKES